MRRLAFLFSLIAALTGTPLRQAEAASDYGRMLTGLLPFPQLEEPDGGVGDDSGAALRDGARAITGADWSSPIDLLEVLPATLGAPASPTGETANPRERACWPPGPPNGRRAWLQRFLF